MPDQIATTAVDVPAPPLPGETFALEIVRSGFAVDGRGFSREIIQQLCDNTLLMMMGARAQVPNQPGHNLDEKGNVIDDRLPLEGVSTRFRTAPSSEDPNELALCADVRLWGQMLADYHSGAFTKRSIYYTPLGTLPDGRLVGPHLKHVAFYGAVPVAMPGLGNAAYNAQDGLIKRLVNGVKTFLTGGSRAQALAALEADVESLNSSPTEAKLVAKPMKKQMLEMCKTMLEYFGSLPDDEPAAVEVEIGGDEENPPAAELAAAKPASSEPTEKAPEKALAADPKDKEVESLKAFAAQSMFDSFVSQGRLVNTAEAKKDFEYWVNAYGLQGAQRHFSALPLMQSAPVAGLRDDGVDPSAAMNLQKARQNMRDLGLSERDIIEFLPDPKRAA